MNRLMFSIVTVTVISQTDAEVCQAQCNKPGVLLSIGASDGAHTLQGDVLRGQGAFLQGMGAFQFGAGQHLESVGRYQLSNQQAQLLAEDVKLKRLETHERKLESKQSRELFKAQTRELARQQKDFAELSALRDHPTGAAIRSGAAANFLLVALGSRTTAVNWNEVVLTPDQLSRVCLQTATGLLPFDHADSLFDAQGQVTWPNVASDLEFAAARKQIETQLGQILKSLKARHPADKAAVALLRQDIARLASQAPKKHSQAKNLAAAMHTRTFLTSLSDAVKQLADDSATQLFDGTLDFQANTVTALADHMTRHNLRFAPTTTHGATVYAKLHEALAATHRQAATTAFASR